MKKVFVFICCIFISVVIAVLFGILHNQLTFTISSEFFTQVLFERYGFVEYGLTTPRVTASIIGVWSTWWIGLIAGFMFGFIGLFCSNAKAMIKSISYVILVMLSITVLVGLLGLSYGFFGFSNLESTCCFPLQIKNVQNFIAVSEMHSFSYVGGGIGILIAVLLQIREIKRTRIN
ncbi:hypothetical protein QQY79_05720 [Flavobacterium tructae]|uniref:hypothetical protein n=1 Tax=Flavobacterium TaxID=237 RepID=UPI00222410C3|nr:MULTISPECIES: hypothetical protein [Flavobacterium]MDL2142010.1 hypothetical protein [Flavobacterium tructae]